MATGKYSNVKCFTVVLDLVQTILLSLLRIFNVFLVKRQSF